MAGEIVIPVLEGEGIGESRFLGNITEHEP
jgi:hypothetical protein